jgi:hypothetical protein
LALGRGAQSRVVENCRRPATGRLETIARQSSPAGAPGFKYYS